jgi:hypothetical protein
VRRITTAAAIDAQTASTAKSHTPSSEPKKTNFASAQGCDVGSGNEKLNTQDTQNLNHAGSNSTSGRSL